MITKIVHERATFCTPTYLAAEAALPKLITDIYYSIRSEIQFQAWPLLPPFSRAESLFQDCHGNYSTDIKVQEALLPTLQVPFCFSVARAFRLLLRHGVIFTITLYYNNQIR